MIYWLSSAEITEKVKEQEGRGQATLGNGQKQLQTFDICVVKAIERDHSCDWSHQSIAR